MLVKITFAYAVPQSNSLQLMLKVGFEFFWVSEFLNYQLPNRHNCQLPNHMKVKYDKSIIYRAAPAFIYHPVILPVKLIQLC
jgi:hypothetical protein